MNTSDNKLDINKKRKLLTRLEEIELAKKMKGYLAIREIGIKEDKDIDWDIVKEKLGKSEKELKLIYNEGFRARQLMIESNLRLVISIAGSFRNRGVEFQDLIQEGTIGLINGIEKFDENFGCKVSTYVSYWIKQALAKSISDNGRFVRLPIHILNIYNKIRNTIRTLTQEFGRVPTNKEILEVLEDLNLTSDSIDAIRLYIRPCISLDIQIPSKKDYKETTTLSDVIDSKDFLDKEDPYKEVYDLILKEDIIKVLNKLEPPQGLIIWYKFGLDSDVNSKVRFNGRSLEDVSTIIGLSREKIRLLEAKAFRTLKTEPYYKYLMDYALEL